MSFALIRLFLGGALKRVMDLLGRFFGSLNSQGWIGLVLCGLLAFLLVRAEGESRHFRKQSQRYERLYNLEHSGRLADRKSYVDAQAAAAAQNATHNAKVEQHYQRNSDNERQSYLNDLARLRGMRGRQNPAAQGASSAASSSAPSTATPRIDEAGLCVPATSDVCEAGAEIELRLMHLQNLNDEQTKVDPNAP